MDVTTPEKSDVSRPPAPGEIFPASKPNIASYDSSIKPSAPSVGINGATTEPKPEPTSSYSKGPAHVIQPTDISGSGSDNGGVTTGSSVSSGEPRNHHRLAIAAVALLVLLLCGGLLLLIIHNAKQQESRLKATERRLERSIKANAKKGSSLKVTNLQVNGNINTVGNYQVNGKQITSGNLADSSNIAFLNHNQTFTGANDFQNAGNVFAGNGAGLSGVPAVTLGGHPASFFQNASNLTSGTLSNSRLPSNLSVSGTISFGTLGVADTSTTLCRNSVNQLATCTGGGSSSSFLQGGNSFGATAILGTNDSNSLTFETNNTTQATIAVGGATTFKNSIDSTAAFQIQNAGGTSLFNVDTTNSSITIGSPSSADTGSWQTNANALPAARQNAVTTTYNGYAYVIGGASDGSTGSACGTATDTVYYALLNGDGTTGAWNTTTAIPSARCGAMGVTADGYIYVIGGNDSGGSDTDTVYYAQPNVNGTITSWTTNAEALPEVKDGGSVVADNGYIYVVDGSGSWNGTGGNDIYWTSLNGDGSTDPWNSDVLPRGMLWGNAQINDGYLYMIGGYNDPAEIDYAPLDSGDGSIGTWNTTTNLPVDLYSMTSVVSNGYLYVLGGTSTSYLDPAVDTVYYAYINSNGTLGGWNTSANPMPTAQEFAGSFMNNGYVYEIGGEDDGRSGAPRSTVYYSQISAPTSGSSLAVKGSAVFQGGDSDSTTALQVQRAGGTAVLTVDTANSQLILRGTHSEASIGGELLTGDCSGTNWSGSGSGPYTHTSAPDASNLFCTISGGVIAGATYRISYDTDIPIIPKIGDRDGNNVTGVGIVQIVTAATTSAPLFNFPAFPGATGTIDNISFELVTTANNVLAVQNSDGTTGLEIRAGGSGLQNTFIGIGSGQANTTGVYNTALGYQALQSNTEGYSNTAVGHRALYSNITGYQNIALGDGALYFNITGHENTALGNSALFINTTGSYNTALGEAALLNNTTGTYNTAIGYYAGFVDPNNTDFATLGNLQNATAIGYGAQVQQSNSLILGGVGTVAANLTPNVGIGTTSPDNLFSVSPNIYDTGTASTTASATVVGSGTTWTANMIGDDFIFANGNKYTITGFTDATHMTLSASSTNASQAYRIHNPAFYVSSTGSAALRTSANSASAFQVLDASNNVALVVSTNNVSGTPNAANATLKVAADSGTSRSINAAGSVNASGADYAEYIPWSGALPEPGTVVQYNGSSYVVSSRLTAAFVGNDKFESTGSILVTFAGQVPVKVSGTANAGDILVDNHDGTAKAINPATASIAQLFGKIGIAEESGSGSVLAAIGTTSANLGGINSLQQGGDANFASLNVSGNTTLTNLTVTGSASVGSLSVTGSAEFTGNITVNGDIILGPNAKVRGNGSTRGQVIIGAGQTDATYTFPSAYSDSPNVVITPTSDPGGSYWVSDITKNGFKVHVGSAPASDLKFNFQVQQ